MKKESWNRRVFIENSLTYFALAVIVFFILFPIYWLLMTSLKQPVDAFAIPPKWVFEPTGINYKEIIFGGGLKRVVGGEFMRDTLNSAIVASCTVALAALIASPAAYSIGRFNFRGRGPISFWILTMLMLPPVVVILPFRIIVQRLNLYDAHLGLIIAHMSFIIPFFIWMMRGFFQEIPEELEDAALVDGCTRFMAFRKIILPLAAPGLAATMIICAIFSWNEFLFALILTGKTAKTAPVGITGFLSFERIIWGKLCAGGAIIAIPPILFAFIAQKYIIRGLTFGAIKG